MQSNNDRINAMFRLLRREHLVARRNFACCGSCAAYELGEIVREKGKRGAVYYNRQEGERLRRGAERVFLNYGAADAEGISDKLRAAESRRIGQAIVRAARKAGLACEWSGSEEVPVRVLLPGGLDGRD